MLTGSMRKLTDDQSGAQEVKKTRRGESSYVTKLEERVTTGKPGNVCCFAIILTPTKEHKI